MRFILDSRHSLVPELRSVAVGMRLAPRPYRNPPFCDEGSLSTYEARVAYRIALSDWYPCRGVAAVPRVRVRPTGCPDNS